MLLRRRCAAFLDTDVVLEEQGDQDGGRPVRGWMFWRRGFWSRPAFFVLAALAAGVAIPVVAVEGYQDLRNERLLIKQTWCWTDPPPCVDDEYGEVNGPRRDRRRTESEWTLSIGSEVYDEFHLEGRYDDEIMPDDEGLVRVLTVDGDVVGVQARAGIVEVWGLGVRGAVRALLWILACVGVAIGALDIARRKAEVRGSWWSVDGEAIAPGSAWGATLLFPASVGLLLATFGSPWWQSWLLACVAAMAAMAVFRPPWRRRVD